MNDSYILEGQMPELKGAIPVLVKKQELVNGKLVEKEVEELRLPSTVRNGIITRSDAVQNLRARGIAFDTASVDREIANRLSSLRKELIIASGHESHIIELALSIRGRRYARQGQRGLIESNSRERNDRQSIHKKGTDFGQSESQAEELMDKLEQVRVTEAYREQQNRLAITRSQDTVIEAFPCQTKGLYVIRSRKKDLVSAKVELMRGAGIDIRNVERVHGGELYCAFYLHTWDEGAKLEQFGVKIAEQFLTQAFSAKEMQSMAQRNQQAYSEAVNPRPAPSKVGKHSRHAHPILPGDIETQTVFDFDWEGVIKDYRTYELRDLELAVKFLREEIADVQKTLGYLFRQKSMNLTKAEVEKLNLALPETNRKLMQMNTQVAPVYAYLQAKRQEQQAAEETATKLKTVAEDILV